MSELPYETGDDGVPRAPWGESKTRAWKRLEREGRYEAFAERKRKIKEQRWGSRPCTDRDWLFFAALSEFPPAGEGVRKVDMPSDADEEASVDDGVIDALLGAKPSVNLVDDVQWAYDQLAAYRAAKDAKKHEAAARIMASGGKGAQSMLSLAYSNPSKFVGDLVPKFLSSTETDEERAFRDDEREQLRLIARFKPSYECPNCGTGEPVKCTVCGAVVPVKELGRLDGSGGGGHD